MQEYLKCTLEPLFGVFKCDLCPLCTQDEESVTNADRRGAVDAAALHGKHCGRQLPATPQDLRGEEFILHLKFPFQILITHKNQASMLMAPQAKSSGFFTSK